MSKMLQIGIVYPREMKSGIGHVACTLGGVSYESRGGRGCVRGSAARGAAHPLFKHHFHRVFSDEQARRAKAWADKCVRLPYLWAAVPEPPPPPVHGGDCSGFVSGIICVAEGRPIGRRFSTGTWESVFRKLGFAAGLGGPATKGAAAPGVLDRPYPGTPVGPGSPKRDHVKWIQARLNFAAKNRHPVLGNRALALDGEYGPQTEKVVVAFQKSRGLEGQGMCGPKTWPLLNGIR